MKVFIAGSKSIHVSSFIEALNNKGIIPTLLAEESLNYGKVNGEFIARFRSKNPFSILINYWKLKRIIRKTEPAVVHIHQANRMAYFVSKICAHKNIPCILTAWGSDVLIVPQKNKFYRFLVKKTLQRSKIITADSKSMVTAMMQLVPLKEKYKLLQYGIDLIEPKPKEKIIYSNRLHNPLYRIDVIIDYFKAFQAKFSDWKLVIAGVGSETENLKKMVKSLAIEEKVRFIGWVDKELNTEMYQKSSIYISIPESDGTSVSLLEAMSAECLPIVPDIDVSKEWILDGKNGVIEKDGENPLIEAVELLKDDFGEINKSLVKSTAERGKCTERFIELYQQVITE